MSDANFYVTTTVNGFCTGRKVAGPKTRARAEADLARIASLGDMTRPGEVLALVEGRPVAEAGAKAARPLVDRDQQRASVLGDGSAMNRDF